jgi:hypothetical protein
VVAPDEVREAFDHPFAYAAARNVCSSLELCTSVESGGSAATALAG